MANKLFSVLEEIVKNMPTKKPLTPEQWRQELNPRRDVKIGDIKHPLKKEEIDYSGINDLTKPMTKEEMLDHLENRNLPFTKEHRGEFGYGQYTLPGSRREPGGLFTYWSPGAVPEKFDRDLLRSSVASLSKSMNEKLAAHRADPKTQAALSLIDRVKAAIKSHTPTAEGKVNPDDPIWDEIHKQHQEVVPNARKWVPHKDLTPEESLKEFSRVHDRYYYPNHDEAGYKALARLEKMMKGKKDRTEDIRRLVAGEGRPPRTQREVRDLLVQANEQNNFFTPAEMEGARLFRSGHFPGEDINKRNLLAHTRTSLRDSRIGEKDIRLIDELQSDWHKSAMNKAAEPRAELKKYKTALAMLDTEPYSVDPSGRLRVSSITDKDDMATHRAKTTLDHMLGEAFRNLPPEQRTAEAAAKNVREALTTISIPEAERAVATVGKGYTGMDAPLKDDAWWQHMMRQEVLKAIEGGQRFVGLPSGQSQIDRYPGLAKNMDRLEWDVTPEGKFNVYPMQRGRHVSSSMDEKIRNLSEKELSDLLGPQLAEQIITKEKLAASGGQQEVGGMMHWLGKLGQYLGRDFSRESPDRKAKWLLNQERNALLEHGFLKQEEADALDRWLEWRRHGEGGEEAKRYFEEQLGHPITVDAFGQFNSPVLGPGVEPKDLMARRIIDRMTDRKDMVPVERALADPDIKVGGMGMRQHYDQKYLNYLNGLARQYGGKEFPEGLPFASPYRVNGIEITPEMVERINKQKGLPMWSFAPAAVIPALAPGEDQQYAVGGAIHGLPRMR